MLARLSCICISPTASCNDAICLIAEQQLKNDSSAAPGHCIVYCIRPIKLVYDITGTWNDVAYVHGTVDRIIWLCSVLSSPLSSLPNAIPSNDTLHFPTPTHTLGQSLLLLSLFSFVTFIVTCGHSGSCIRILTPKAIKITAHVDCTMPWSETYAISIDIGNNFEPPQCTITNWQRDARMNSPTHREAHRLAVCPPTYNFMLLRLTQQTHNTKVQKSA